MLELLLDILHLGAIILVEIVFEVLFELFLSAELPRTSSL